MSGRTTATISFYCRDSRVDKNGYAPICVMNNNCAGWSWLCSISCGYICADTGHKESALQYVVVIAR